MGFEPKKGDLVSYGPWGHVEIVKVYSNGDVEIKAPHGTKMRVAGRDCKKSER